MHEANNCYAIQKQFVPPADYDYEQRAMLYANDTADFSASRSAQPVQIIGYSV